MKIKQKLKPLLYTAAVLCMSLSCKKDPPPEDQTPLIDYSCNDGTCCGPPTAKYTFIKEFKDEPVGFGYAGIPSLGFKNEILYQGRAIYPFRVCELSLDVVKDWEDGFKTKDFSFKYRISGKIFFCECQQPFTKDGYYYSVLIEKEIGRAHV